MRRSRRPRLHISNGPGIVDFDLPAERLIELGSAIGHTLNEDDAHLIIGSVRYFQEFEPCERNAPFVEDAHKRAEEINFHISRLFELFSSGYSRAREPYGIISSYVESLFEQETSTNGDTSGRNRYRDLYALLFSFEIVGQRILNRIEEDIRHGGFVEGDFWDVLVNDLTDWAKIRGFPTGASKGRNKTVSDKPSPFVCFLKTLQGYLPQEQRRHMHSDEALAEAIHKARRKHKGPSKSGANDG